MSDEKIKPIVEAFDVDSFDFEVEEFEVDSSADAFAPYQLAPSGLYYAKIAYYEKEKGMRKETFAAKAGKEEQSVLAVTCDIVLIKPVEEKLRESLTPEDYENQHVFFRANSNRRRDNGASKFTAIIACADADFVSGRTNNQEVAQRVNSLLYQGFEGVVEVDWEGYNANTQKTKRGMASFPKDPKRPGRKIARYTDVDGTVVDGRLSITRLIPASQMVAAATR